MWKEKRKIQKIAGVTYTVSIPKDMAEVLELEKGEEVEVKYNKEDKQLIVSKLEGGEING